MAFSMPSSFRPSAPANTRLSSPVNNRRLATPHQCREPRCDFWIFECLDFRIQIRQFENSKILKSNMSLSQTPATDSSLAVSLSGVVRHFGRFAALRGITADFAPGKLYVVLGENGAGKSTLLRIIAGLLAPTSGTVCVLGHESFRQA